MASMSFGPLSCRSSPRASPGDDPVHTWAAVFGATRSRSARLHAREPRPVATAPACTVLSPELLLVVDVAGTAWNAQIEDKLRYAHTTASAGGFGYEQARIPAFRGQVLRTQHRPRPGRAEQELCALALARGSPGTAGMCRFQRIASGLAPYQAALPGQGTTWFRFPRPAGCPSGQGGAPAAL
jgi:hypothetical protein